MLVTFKTPSYSNITMFGSVAITFIKMMGHSGTVPGSIGIADLPEALRRLEEGLQEPDESVLDTGEQSPESVEIEPEDRVDLATRVLPLKALLQAAIEEGDDIMWK